MRVYELFIFYIHMNARGNKCEDSLETIFIAENHVDALDSMMRHIANRKEAVSEYFSDLGCVKLSVKTIGPIDQDGELTNSSYLPFFEWKQDFPSTLERCVEFGKKRHKG